MEKEIVGYKWLAKYSDGVLVSPVAACNAYLPLEQVTWVDGHLEAHEEPGERRRWWADKPKASIPPSVPYSSGIHAYKDIEAAHESNPVRPLETILVLVKVLLSGKVIEGEEGYRAQYADIIEEISNDEIESVKREIDARRRVEYLGIPSI